MEAPLIASAQEPGPSGETETKLKSCSTCGGRVSRCWGLALYAVLILFILSALSWTVVRLALGSGGHIDRDPIVTPDGYVIEPNTNSKFKVETINKRTNTQMRLIGVGLRDKSAVGMHFRVDVWGLYVGLEKAKKMLSKHKSDPNIWHPDVLNTLAPNSASEAKFVPLTIEWRMLMSPPGSHMVDPWADALDDIWKGQFNFYDPPLSEEDVKQLDSAFRACVKPGFKTSDVFTMEWESPRACVWTYNSKKTCPADLRKPFELCRGETLHEFKEFETTYKGGLTDLLRLLWWTPPPT